MDEKKGIRDYPPATQDQITAERPEGEDQTNRTDWDRNQTGYADRDLTNHGAGHLGKTAQTGHNHDPRDPNERHYPNRADPIGGSTERPILTDARGRLIVATTDPGFVDPIADPAERAKAFGYVDPVPVSREDRVTAVIASLEHAHKHNSPISRADLMEIEALLLPEADQAALAVKRLNMPRFRARAPHVNAVQVPAASAAPFSTLIPMGLTVDPETKVMTVPTVDGPKTVVAGDWLVRNEDGTLGVIAAADFADQYETA